MGIRENDALTVAGHDLTASEHQALQVRWNQDSQALESLQAELAHIRTDWAKERERREAA